MTLTVVWHDVVLIANPVNMVYSDHSVLYYTFGLSKNCIPPGRIRNSLPPLPYFGQSLFPLYQICLFSVPPQNSLSPPPPPPPTHTHTHRQRKNDRSLIDNHSRRSRDLRKHTRNGHLGKVPGGFEPGTPRSPVQHSNH